MFLRGRVRGENLNSRSVVKTHERDPRKIRCNSGVDGKVRKGEEIFFLMLILASIFQAPKPKFRGFFIETKQAISNTGSKKNHH